MRKIEKKIVGLLHEAIQTGSLNGKRKRSLTKRDSVRIQSDGTIQYVLWGSPIVKVKTLDDNKSHDVEITLDSCGHETLTTKSRLNAILRGLKAAPYYQIYQENWVWHLYGANSEEKDIEFKSPFTFKAAIHV